MVSTDVSPGVVEEEGIEVVCVDNPQAFNALSSKIIAGLVEDFTLACSDSETRAIIFRGAEVEGKVKFLSSFAGADLTMLVNTHDWQPVSADVARWHMEEGINAIKKINALCRREGGFYQNQPVGRVVVIGVVDGPCLAGGIEFVFGLSDIVLATSRSVFGMREILFGGMGGWRGPQKLRELLRSPLWVNEMLLALGDKKVGDISAETACARGLVNYLVPENKILDEAMRIAVEVTKRDRLAVTFNLAAAEHPAGQDCTEAVTGMMVHLMQRDAWVNGVRGFLEKGKR